MTYTVSTVRRDAEGCPTVVEIGRYSIKIIAMKVARDAAHTSDDCVTYGPSSIAYIGRDITAVIAWGDRT